MLFRSTEIGKAKRPLPAMRTGTSPPEDEYETLYWDDALLRATLKDIRETSVLLRALEWVHSASQDARVATYIQESTASIHSAIKDFDQHTVRSITDWCLFASMQPRLHNEQRDCPPHLVLAATVPEGSATIHTSINNAVVMPISFMREGLLAVCQRFVMWIIPRF